MQKYQWATWIPYQSLVVRGTSEGENLKVGVIAASSQLALIYFSNNSFARIMNKIPRSVTALWFDSREGQEVPAGEFSTNEQRDIIPPVGWEDAILILKGGE